VNLLSRNQEKKKETEDYLQKENYEQRNSNFIENWFRQYISHQPIIYDLAHLKQWIRLLSAAKFSGSIPTSLFADLKKLLDFILENEK
jgi:hypothetical protein